MSVQQIPQENSCKPQLLVPHFLMQKGFDMQNIRSFFVIITAIAALAAAALLTASLTVAFMGTLAVLSLGKALSSRLKPVPVRAKTKQSDMRVWNDGRGTIIDM
jgi:hypothetical protein